MMELKNLNQLWHIKPTFQALDVYRKKKTDARNLPLHISALQVCHSQGVFTVVKEVLSKWSAVCSTVTHLHT